ncbi:MULTISPECIES: hypothetical protein [unclassified Fibrobacter]|uniref:hypothetical protein n=1 Tax=unclassified Fibrobacter TaxID=2634177 RepID=UPI000D6B2618|nr:MULTISPECIES: hypothetical protein [unclassified Fibrobacter]PWJ63052.1 hypothetical protein BGX12_11953 [Fibrobacter sp. UWR4]PZW68223.1 hypothetical protein C8E88_101953 [Fibrobacter sp. UWR1]
MKLRGFLKSCRPTSCRTCFGISCLLTAFTINIFFLALCLIFGDLKFGAIDDYFMAAVLTGAHGTDYNPHLLFVNALYGYALIPLYKLFPTIGWYYIGEMFSVFLSLTTISYIIIKKMGNQWGTLIATLFVAMFASDYYLVVQFTQCASLLSATGMLVFANAVTQEPSCQTTSCRTTSCRTRFGIGSLVPEPSLRKQCFGISYLPFAYALFLLLWGSVMRWEAFLMGMPFFCIGLLFLIKRCWTNKVPVIITLTIMFTAAFSLHSWDRNLYNTPEYKPYMEIQNPRAALGDGSNYNQNAVYEDLEEMGQSAKDYDMLTRWLFYDTETFAKDSMLSIVGVIGQYRDKNQKADIPRQLLNALGHSLKMPMFWSWFIAGLIILATNRKKFPYLWTSLGSIFLLMTMLLAQNRLVYRVEGGFWLYTTILAIPLWAPVQFEKANQIFNRKIVIVILGVIAFANLFTYITNGDSVRDPSTGKTRTLAVDDSTDYSQVLAHIDSNPNTMFLANMRTYMVFSQHKMPPYKAEPFGSYRNIISFGYWTPYLPEITKTLAEYGITNPMKDVVHENVVVINEPKLGDFLTRHYYSDSIAVDTLRTIGKTEFYKYRLVQK